MFRRFSFSTFFMAAVVVLAMSDLVQADSFGAAAPLVLAIQQLGGTLALAVEEALAPVLGQLSSSGLPLSPALILGAGAAIALNLVRARARRERGRGRGGARSGSKIATVRRPRNQRTAKGEPPMPLNACDCDDCCDDCCCDDCCC